MRKKFLRTSNLSKLFNKNTGKLSYICLPKISTFISRANQKRLREIKILNHQIVTVLRKKTAPLRDDFKYSV